MKNKNKLIYIEKKDMSQLLEIEMNIINKSFKGKWSNWHPTLYALSITTFINVVLHAQMIQAMKCPYLQNVSKEKNDQPLTQQSNTLKRAIINWMSQVSLSFKS